MFLTGDIKIHQIAFLPLRNHDLLSEIKNINR